LLPCIAQHVGRDREPVEAAVRVEAEAPAPQSFFEGLAGSVLPG
jgi:hypothetical protein